MAATYDLTGRRALVTGATRGIGAGIADTLAAAGATVLCTARDRARLAEVAARIEAGGGRAEAFAADLSDPVAVLALARWAGEVDVLVNNAGVGDKFVPVTEPDDEHWRSTFAVDFFAPLLLIRELGRDMAARRRGSIINISSVSGQWAQPMMGAYNCAKAALESLTRTAALELGDSGVRVNTVAPGVIRTELAESFLQGPVLHFFESQALLGRVGEVADVANLVAFLASDQSAYLSGSTINLDGGTLAGNKALSLALAASRAGV